MADQLDAVPVFKTVQYHIDRSGNFEKAPIKTKYYGTSLETKPIVNIVDGDLFVETDTTKEYEWNGSSWTLVKQSINGAAYANLRNASGTEISLEDSSVTAAHIAAGTAASSVVTAGSWFNRTGYSEGVIELTVNDVTPAGDLGGNFEVSYSLDAGVTSSTFETLTGSTVANIGADDDQIIMVSFTALKAAPYFKIRTALSGTLTAVTVGVNIYAKRLRG